MNILFTYTNGTEEEYIRSRFEKMVLKLFYVFLMIEKSVLSAEIILILNEVLIAGFIAERVVTEYKKKSFYVVNFRRRFSIGEREQIDFGRSFVWINRSLVNTSSLYVCMEMTFFSQQWSVANLRKIEGQYNLSFLKFLVIVCHTHTHTHTHKRTNLHIYIYPWERY